MDPSMMGDPNAGGDDGGFGGSLIPGGGDDADAEDDGDGDDSPPWAKGGEGAGDSAADPSDDGDTEAEVGGKKKPPFTKKKSARQGYRTATGHVLPTDVFMQHLAIASAKDPNQMAAAIKEINEAAG
jgi:hypothetical protein